MGLSTAERKAVTRQMARRYKRLIADRSNSRAFISLRNARAVPVLLVVRISRTASSATRRSNPWPDASASLANSA